MSRDDDDDRYSIDYRQAFPVSNRNRRRHAEKPKAKEPEPATSRFAPKAVKKEASMPSGQSRRDVIQRADEHPLRSMGAVAREMIAKDLNQPLAEQCEQLEAMGYEAPGETIGVIREEIFKVLRLCKRHGSIIIPAWADD